MKIAQY